MGLTTIVDPQNVEEHWRNKCFSWSMPRREILRNLDPEASSPSLEETDRHPEATQVEAKVWSVVFVSLLFSWVIGKHCTVGGVEKNEFQNFWGNCSIGKREENPREISCSRSSVPRVSETLFFRTLRNLSPVEESGNCQCSSPEEREISCSRSSVPRVSETLFFRTLRNLSSVEESGNCQCSFPEEREREYSDCATCPMESYWNLSRQRSGPEGIYVLSYMGINVLSQRVAPRL